jgi:RNA polymerase sigma-70 factor, ECF subfamily
MAPERPVDELLPVIYDELKRLAAAYLRRERPGHTLQPTALVHEAYLRLLRDRPDRWQNRAHFCAIAAHSMRQILIERARARHAQKRGGARARVTLDDGLIRVVEPSVDLVALDEALERLQALDPTQARLVELRFFGGLTIDETAEAMHLIARHREASLDGGARMAGAGAGRQDVTPERWRQVNALFHAVVDRDPAERQALLDEATRGDPDLAADVRSLLEACDSGDWLERPAWAVAPELILDAAAPLEPGSQAGPYRIEREIGRGGMGIVYEAEDTRLRRRVA